jgi:hypothetical protein
LRTCSSIWFQGRRRRSAREISELVEDVGGDLGASTDRELTAFYASLLAPDSSSGSACSISRRPHFDPKHLELEKKVVLQELAERDTVRHRVRSLRKLHSRPSARPVGLGSEESSRDRRPFEAAFSPDMRSRPCRVLPSSVRLSRGTILWRHDSV